MTITFHPGCAKAHPSGYRPVVTLRDHNGAVIWREAVSPDTYDTKDAARNHARWSAHRVAERLAFARVA